MNTPENFSNHPMTVGEIKSDKSQNSADWSPRDMLIHVLRKIDSGEIAPVAAVIALKHPTEHEKTRGGFYVASPDSHLTLGMLAGTMFRIQSEE